MLLLIHVVIALTSVGFSTYTFFSPTHSKLRLSSGLVAATLTSGTYLVISTHSPMLSSCISGLTYTGIVLSLIISARYKLAKAQAKN